MKFLIALTFVLVGTMLAGCSFAALTGTLNPTAETSFASASTSTDTVTTASGVRIDPTKHRAITYQMW